MTVTRTDVVVSTAGTENQQLTMTTAMVVNAYKDLMLRHQGVNYKIDSNSSSVITLETPAVGYTDLATETVQIITNYATIKQCESRLRVTLDVHSGRKATTQEIGEYLDGADGYINEEIGLSDETINTVHFKTTLRKIEIDLVAMFVQQGSLFLKVNPGANAVSYWQTTPDFTNKHLRTLRRIKLKIRRRNRRTAYIYDKTTGDEILI